MKPICHLWQIAAYANSCVLVRHDFGGAHFSMSNPDILFITAFHPGGKGVVGAGEAISEDTLRALHSSGKNVHVLCLAPQNQTANPEVVSLCGSYSWLTQTRGQTFMGILHGWAHGSLLAPWLFTRVSPRNVGAAREIILRNDIDEVWLDFPSTLGFAPALHVASTVYFVHDVVTQNIGRRKLLGMLGPWVQKTEKKLLSFVGKCLVLSRKDEDLLRAIGFHGEILLQPPSQVRVGDVGNALPVARILEEFAGRKNLVFFGKMKRPENHWSIIHFLLFSYPKIRRCHGDVQFWVIGLLPRFTLRLLGRIIPGVRIVGAVDDPYPAFRAASLCVAPLRLGAGVKIKVLQMLDAGAKIVASPIGGEGISPASNLIVVPYEDIADTVCRILANPD
jgi:glycosyltransferase involved in cell wall biosynthesis